MEPSETPVTTKIPLLRGEARKNLTKQLEALADVNLTQLSCDSIANWPKIVLRGKQYIPEEWTAKKRSRRSWISDHGSFLVEIVKDSSGGTFWCCKYCNKVFNSIATRSAALHLNNEHNKFDDTKPQPSKKPRQSVLELQQRAARYQFRNQRPSQSRSLLCYGLFVTTSHLVSSRIYTSVKS